MTYSEATSSALALARTYAADLAPVMLDATRATLLQVAEVAVTAARLVRWSARLGLFVAALLVAVALFGNALRSRSTVREVKAAKRQYLRAARFATSSARSLRKW